MNERSVKIITKSPKIRDLLAKACKLAESNLNPDVVNGTGKEVLVDFIQSNSSRNSRSFIKVNCAAFAESLLDNELFGHERPHSRVRTKYSREYLRTHPVVLFSWTKLAICRNTAVWNPANGRLYGPRGIATCASALHPGGTLAVWSAGPAPRYLKALQEAGLQGRARPLPAEEGGGSRHVLILATRSVEIEEGDRRRKATDSSPLGEGSHKAPLIR